MKKIRSTLLVMLLLLGVLVACTETEISTPVPLPEGLERETVPMPKQEPELSRSIVTLTIKEQELHRRLYDFPEDAVTTTQLRRRGDTIVLETWNHEWIVMTIEDILDNYVVVHLDAYYTPNGTRNAETVEIAYGEEFVFRTPTFSAAVEWTLVFDDRINFLAIPSLW